MGQEPLEIGIDRVPVDPGANSGIPHGGAGGIALSASFFTSLPRVCACAKVRRTIDMVPWPMTYDLHGPVTTVQVESTVDILDPDCCRRVRFRSTPFEAVRSVFSRYCWPGGLPSFCLVCTDAALGLAHFLNLHVYYCTLYFTSVDD